LGVPPRDISNFHLARGRAFRSNLFALPFLLKIILVRKDKKDFPARLNVVRAGATIPHAAVGLIKTKKICPFNCLMLRNSISIILVCGFLSCKKDIGVPNTPPHPTCPIAHELDFSKNGTMKDTWRFVGFQNEGSEEIESPPCDVVLYDFNGSPLTFHSGAVISFPDKLANQGLDSTYSTYSHRYQGSVQNSFFGGCDYDNTNLKLGPKWQTLAGGPDVIMGLEDKFHDVLRGAKTYNIHHNLLTINCGTKGKMLFVLK